ncbi:MAG: hypothetical protein AABZ47_11385 [Planctomycetota bacterium]
MPGRPKGTARKVAELERSALALYQQFDEATPAIHKQAPANGGTWSPWVSVYQAANRLLLATAELGEHCRNAAQLDERGPIESGLGVESLRRIHAQFTDRFGGRDAADGDSLREEIRKVEGQLPAHAHISDEISWVASNLHRPDPDVAKAPSLSAINMFTDLRADQAMRRDFWNIVWSKRLSPGDRRPRKSAFEGDDLSDEEEKEANDMIMRRIFGDGAAEIKN